MLLKWEISGAVCKLGTAEVVEEDPLAETRYAFWDGRFGEARDRVLIPEEGSITSCLNICRLTPETLPTCIGFVISEPRFVTYAAVPGNYVDCYPLFKDTGEVGGDMRVRVYAPQTGDRAFSIERCPT